MQILLTHNPQTTRSHFAHYVTRTPLNQPRFTPHVTIWIPIGATLELDDRLCLQEFMKSKCEVLDDAMPTTHGNETIFEYLVDPNGYLNRTFMCPVLVSARKPLRHKYHSDTHFSRSSSLGL